MAVRVVTVANRSKYKVDTTLKLVSDYRSKAVYGEYKGRVSEDVLIEQFHCGSPPAHKRKKTLSLPKRKYDLLRAQGHITNDRPEVGDAVIVGDKNLEEWVETPEEWQTYRVLPPVVQ